MTELTEAMFKIFDRKEFSFKKLKEQYSAEELTQIKDEYKQVWQEWKKVNLAVASSLPDNTLTKVHVESWTNGWNLRDHFWAAYRLNNLADKSPCIGVMLDRKQLQVYLMFQHYKSEKRGDTPVKYNQLLKQISAWSKEINLQNWYLWDKDEMEFDDHLPLKEYLANNQKQVEFNKEAEKTSFLLGKFAFRSQDHVKNMEGFIKQGIMQLLPLYQQLEQ